MTEALAYILPSALFLLAGYLCYKCVLSGFRQPAFNRAVIIAIYAVSAAWFIIPEIKFSTGTPYATAVIESGATATNLEHGSGGSKIPWGNIAAWIWIAGIVFFSVRTIAGTISLIRYIHKGKRINHEDYTLVITDGSVHAPFSWMNYIVVDKEDLNEDGNMIIRHELAHIRRCHTLDIILSHLFCIVQWFNPGAWLMKEELRIVQEYQADEDVISSGANLKDYQLILIKKAVGNRFHQPTNSLNHSQLKKRLTMMQKSKSKLGAKICAAVLAPAMLVAAAVVNIPAVASAMDALKPYKDSGYAQQMQTESAGKLLSSTSATDDAVDTQDVLPKYPGGEAAMMMFLIKNVKYPEEAVKKGIEGDVIVALCIDTDGSVTDVNVPEPVNPILDAEAIRVVKMMPRWEPGKSNGKTVKVSMRVPVKFRLSK